MKHKIVITGSFAQAARALLEHEGFGVKEYGAVDLLAEPKLLEALKDADGYILGGDEVASANVITSNNSLKIIAFMGTGYQRFIDVAAATAKGALVSSTPGANKQAVAEMTIGLILAARRKIAVLNQRARANKWKFKAGDLTSDEKSHRLPTRNLQGQTIGIVGMGPIGQRVAEIAHNGLGMRIVYYSRNRKDDIEKSLDAQMMPLRELLSISDVVSLHVSFDPANPETKNLIGEYELSLMKPEAILVNTARAELVDGSALHDALLNFKLDSAAFDGYYSEPAPAVADDTIGLMRLPTESFLVTPHIAFLTEDSDIEMSRIAAQSVIDVLRGRHNQYVINYNQK